MADTETSVTEKEAQWKQFKAAATELKEGEDRYLVTLKWFSRWRGFVQGKISDKPPPIDNDILEPKRYRAQSIEPLNQAQWSMLSKWYGGGPEIQRRVLCDEDGKLFVEANLWKINVEYRSSTMTLYCSERTICWDLFTQAVNYWRDGLTTENSRMRRKFIPWEMEDFDKDVISSGLISGATLKLIKFR